MDRLIRILLVDDDQEDYLITEDLLQDVSNRNYELQWASSYQEGLKRIRERQHDIFLVDYRLGAQSGLELVRTAIGMGVIQPILLLTGQGDREIDEQATRAGASDYLVKGELTASNLERAIRYSLERARNLQEIRQLNHELEARVTQRTYQLEETNRHLQQQIRETRAAQDHLRQSQMLYRLIASYFPRGIVAILDANYTFLLVDGNDRELFRGHEKPKPGQSILTYLGHVKEPLEQTLFQARGESQQRMEFRFNNRHCKLIAVPVPAQREQGQMLLVVINDVTEERHMAQEMEKALAKERELNELKSRFVSMASHEFRTPLSTILSSASLLMRYPQIQESEKPMRHLQRIKNSVNQLNDILEDFLSLSRLEEGAIEIRPQAFRPRALAESLAEDLSMHAKPEQHIDFAHQGPDQEVLTDPRLLRNILTNLLSNALKYSGPGTTVRFHCQQGEDHLHFEIADQGIGIPREELDHLFTRFFRASNATNIQGTGLGLNIVNRYLDLLNGTIEYDTVLNQGTTFYLHLPVKAISHEEDFADRG